jgi:hypothetical protein
MQTIDFNRYASEAGYADQIRPQCTYEQAETLCRMAIGQMDAEIAKGDLDEATVWCIEAAAWSHHFPDFAAAVDAASDRCFAAGGGH